VYFARIRAPAAAAAACLLLLLRCSARPACQWKPSV